MELHNKEHSLKWMIIDSILMLIVVGHFKCLTKSVLQQYLLQYRHPHHSQQSLMLKYLLSPFFIHFSRQH